MFDFHAHYGQDNSEALISLVKEEEWSKADGLGFLSFGLLPWLEDNVPARIGRMLESHPGSFMGEIGLDKRFGDSEYQRKVFAEAVDIARSLDRPIIVHSVGTTEECLDMLRSMKVRYAIFHSYCSSYELAKKIVDAGYDISLSRRCFHLRDYDRIVTLPYLLETDMETGERQKREIGEMYRRLRTDYQAQRRKELWKDSL